MNGWMVVELLGHVKLVGEVSEVEAFGGKLGRVDALQRDGTVVTQFFNAASIYRLTPTTEEMARQLMTPVIAPLPLGCSDPFTDDDDDFFESEDNE